MDGANAEANQKMSNKQLGLGQYRLHDLTEMEPVTGVEEVETLLTPGPSMAAGTEQQKIADVPTVITYDTRYLEETSSTDYGRFEQSTLDVGVPVEMEQAEIIDYNNSRSRVASD